jgi:general secretion pathway protein G
MTTLKSTKRRAGFSLIEVIVAMAIMIIMAAVVLPSIVRSLDQARVADGVSELQKIGTGANDFQDDVGEYPRRITQLTTKITTALRACDGGTYVTGEVNSWDGPYFDRFVAASGLPVSIGLAQDSFPTTATSLTIVVNNVSVADAIDIDAELDGDLNSATGGVRWTGTDPGVLSYVVTASGC